MTYKEAASAAYAALERLGMIPTDDYVEQEMSPFARKLEARGLRSRGQSYRSIARTLGVSPSTIRRDIEAGPDETGDGTPIKGVTIRGQTGIEYPPKT